jgi:hypothetical protein
MAKTIMTKWAVRAFIVSGGNGYDGWQTSGERDHGVINLRLKIETCQGTPLELREIIPSYYQFARALGAGCAIEVYQEGSHFNVFRASDNYPIGALSLLEPKELFRHDYTGWV